MNIEVFTKLIKEDFEAFGTYENKSDLKYSTLGYVNDLIKL